MPILSRRNFLGKAAATAITAGVVANAKGLAAASPETDATYDGHIEGPVRDRGGQLVNIKNPRYGAKGNTQILLSGGVILAGSVTFIGAGAFAAETSAR